MKVFKKKAHAQSQSLLTGRLKKVGEKQAQTVVLMEFLEPPEILHHQIQRKGFAFDNKDHYHMISEGEYVLL